MKPKLKDSLLTQPQRELLESMDERDICGLSVWFVGNQVASCKVSDPNAMGGVGPDEMDGIVDWHYPCRLVPPLLKWGFIEKACEAPSASVGILQTKYVTYRITDGGRRHISARLVNVSAP